MIQIPQGEIILRDNRIKKRWKVSIEPFLLSQYPLTQDIYYNITHSNPSTFKGTRNPVENVTWNDAIKFCNLLSTEEGLEEVYSISNNNEEISCNWNSKGYRLPTEAEWEYACRGKVNKVRYDEIDDIAWYNENSENKTHPVGEKKPNDWGLHDMLGNVWEWCWDLYDEKEYGSYRIFRGGGWGDQERGCLASNRRRSHPTFYIDDLGFRIARST